MDAETFYNGVFNVAGCIGRVTRVILVVLGGEALGGFGGIGEWSWIPDVFGIGRVEFC